MKTFIKTTLLLLFCNSLLAGSPFHQDQEFNHRTRILPYSGIDMLRQSNPYILIRDISNATNGKQENRLKLVTLPERSGSPYFRTTSSYEWDKSLKKWKILQVKEYAIQYNGSGLYEVSSFLLKKTFGDSSQNRLLLYTFFLKGGRADSLHIFRISDTDTLLSAREHFHYGSNGELLSMDEETPDSLKRYEYGYDAQGRLRSELQLAGAKNSNGPDSICRLQYAYDSLNRITSYSEERFLSPGNAVTVLSKQYAYDMNGHLSSCRTNRADSQYLLVPEGAELYTWNASGKPETIVRMLKHDGFIFTERYKLEIFYDGGIASYGYEYPWLNNDYSHFASSFYLFGRSDPSLSVQAGQTATAGSVFPNPARDEITLPDGYTGKDILICDAGTGQTVLRITCYDGQAARISELENGWYLLICEGMPVQRFIKS